MTVLYKLQTKYFPDGWSWRLVTHVDGLIAVVATDSGYVTETDARAAGGRYAEGERLNRGWETVREWT